MKTTLIYLFIFSALSAYSINDSTFKEFKIHAEFRPRTEFRNGYRALRTDSSNPAFFTSQRTRLTLQYEQDQKFIFNFSLQDVRFWGEDDPRSTDGTIQVFEAYIEPAITKNLSARIGKQRVMYDNERLFAQNDWRQNAGTHDALRLMWYKKNLQADIMAAFNQAEEKNFETYYTPVFSSYKSLFVHFLKYNISNSWSYTHLHATEGFQDLVDLKNTFYRNTSGGRLEWQKNRLYLTLSAYYQYGETPLGKDLNAFYLQPELRFSWTKKFKSYLGAEIFSGDNGENPVAQSHSFDALYGVNHRFLGTMDYFIRFPKDFNNAGIINPYLFLFYDFSPKISLKSDLHLFYSQNKFVVQQEIIPSYLAFENDILLTFKPNTYTKIDLGLSWLKATQSMEYIKQGGNADKLAQWAYVQITCKPELFYWIKKNNTP